MALGLVRFSRIKAARPRRTPISTWSEATGACRCRTNKRSASARRALCIPRSISTIGVSARDASRDSRPRSPSVDTQYSRGDPIPPTIKVFLCDPDHDSWGGGCVFRASAVRFCPAAPDITPRKVNKIRAFRGFSVSIHDFKAFLMLD